MSHEDKADFSLTSGPPKQRLYLFASRLGGWALRTSRQWFLNRGKPICSIWSFLFVIKTRVWYIQKVLRPSEPTDWGSPDSNQNCEASAFWCLMSYEKLEQIMSTTHDGERTLSNGLETKTLSSSAPHWSQACMEQSICNWVVSKNLLWRKWPWSWGYWLSWLILCQLTQARVVKKKRTSVEKMRP